MKKFIITSMFIVALVLSGCSASTLTSLAGAALGAGTSEPMVGIDTEVGDDKAVLGDNKDSTIDVGTDDVAGNVNVKTDNSETTNTKNIGEANNVNFYEGLSKTDLLWVALLTWLLPNHSAIYREIKSWFVKSKEDN